MTQTETKKRLLITGSSGFVGRAFAKRWAERYELICPSHATMDISNKDDVLRFCEQHRPHLILHLAALANTGYCEQHPEESFKVNVQGTQHMAIAAAACGAKMVYFSSDQVYNGNLEKGGLSEELSVAPENHYGRHKLLAEQWAAEASPEAVGLRATWMYDARQPDEPQRLNFVINFEEALKTKTPLTFAVREYRGITWLRDVVELLPHTFELPGGVYNYGATNELNTYQTACRYFEMLHSNLSTDSMVQADEKRFPQHVRNIAIDNTKILQASNGKICFGNTIDGLQRFAHEQQKTR